MQRKNINYFLGLNIGTNSVGYAVTDTNYNLIKYRGEPMWGVHIFESPNESADRRSFRTARRRLNRRQERVHLLSELFAKEISKVDPQFFKRLAKSRLRREETGEPYTLFPAWGYTDVDYHHAYPTIHHLLQDLMQSTDVHDVRLVFLACSWLVTHRGHFLFDTSTDKVGDLIRFEKVYSDFLGWLSDNGFDCPWPMNTESKTLEDIIRSRTGVNAKLKRFSKEVFLNKKIKKEATDTMPFSQASIVRLLCGGKVSLADLFGKEEYKDAEPKSVALASDDEEFASVLEVVGDDGELLCHLRALNDCCMLAEATHGKNTISEAKVEIYEQHHEDLRWLKYFIRKYHPDKFQMVFKEAGKNNYAAYSYNTKYMSKGRALKLKSTTQKEFCDFLRKLIEKTEVEECDKDVFENVIERLKAYTFMSKQRHTVNRVIPYQLYYYELDRILKNAEHYLSFLSEPDEDGITVSDKIRSIFVFKIPYYVGPLNINNSKNAWMVRKAEGKILPWNFEDKVDLDMSEEHFIRRMTNTCTYLPGEPVLPKNSILYARFMVLNEINHIKINGYPIPVEAKQLLFNKVFKKSARVSVASIKKCLIDHHYATKESQFVGLDIAVKSSYKPYIQFSRLIEDGILTVDDAECIIERMAYTQDKRRLMKWLAKNYPQLPAEDQKYIAKLNFKDFGRLSKRFLTEVYHEDKDGNKLSIMDALWHTNDDLMQLLSDRYSYAEQIQKFTTDFYMDPINALTLEDRLTAMRIPGGVKRPIYRTLNILSDIAKVMGHAPKRVFVKMLRGGGEKGKRTESRKEQLLKLYAEMDDKEVYAFRKQLEAIGDAADICLQSDKLFLYYSQLGRCMYTGQKIDLGQLSGGQYNIDHIYPQAFVKDDSLDNKVLVDSNANGNKKDDYPISPKVQEAMAPLWKHLYAAHLVSDEKYKRLTRTTPFSDEEKYGFINRQLVVTRQSTKVIAQLMCERFGKETEILYVKAGLVSDFRREYDLAKCRSVNDLHHAKDAYLNIVVGNVYHMRFSRRWFSVDQKYSVKTKVIFSRTIKCGSEIAWRGAEDLERVIHTIRKNNIHLTRYAFCRRGGFFDQLPLKAAKDLVPLKQGLDTEKYGGYNRTAASYYMIASYAIGEKKDIMFVPIELMYSDKVEKDEAYAKTYVSGVISQINSGKAVSDVAFPLGHRKVKINTVIELDGMRVTLSGKASRGSGIILKAQTPLVLDEALERYVKRLDGFVHGKKSLDKITAAENKVLYDVLTRKMQHSVFSHCPGNFAETLVSGRELFEKADIESQCICLMNIIGWFNSGAGGCDLRVIGGSANSGSKVPSAKLSNLTKKYSDIRIIDISASGIFESYTKIG